MEPIVLRLVELDKIAKYYASLDEIIETILAKGISSLCVKYERDPVLIRSIIKRIIDLADKVKLKELYFLKCRFDDHAISDLSELLTKLSITHLQIQAPITDITVEILISLISSGKWLPQTLYLHSATVSKDTYHKLFQALKYNQTIQKFGIPKNSGDIQAIPNTWLEDCFAENTTLVEIQCTKKDKGFFQLVKWFALRNKVCQDLSASPVQRNSIPQNLDTENNIRMFLDELQKSSQPLRSMKLVILGHGRVGKTTLLTAMKKILNPQEPTKFEDICSTVGIGHEIFSIANGEVSVWDFAGQMEYTATHSFFLSIEMTSILVCFNLAVPRDDQISQLKFWLNFLNSSLSLPSSPPPPSLSSSSSSPPPSSSTSKVIPKWNIILVGVQADKQEDKSFTENPKLVLKWRNNWPRLPISSSLFSVSSLHNSESVHKLLTFVESECNIIFDKHAVQIPKSYSVFPCRLKEISQEYPIIHWKELFKKFSEELKMEESVFKLMLKYIEGIGQIVCLPNGVVFTDPTVAPKIAAKFVSPKDVRLVLLKKETEKVWILDEREIGSLLDIDTTTNQNLLHELELMVHLKMCFTLHIADSTAIYYLFPSLSTPASSFSFSLPPENKGVAGVKFIAPPGLIFVSGFFCQLLVSVLSFLNIYKEDIHMVCENGAVIRCPGLFAGELIVLIEPSSETIIFAMNASDPDIEYCSSVFTDLVQQNFSQYAETKKENLCGDCIKLCLFDKKIKPEEIGSLRPNHAVCSSTRQHRALVDQRPFYQHQAEKCRSHQQDHHHIFLNYRVYSEGNRAKNSSVESSAGAIEYMFRELAKRKTKNGAPIFVFWDVKCLNDGQDWEAGFMRGLRHSQVVVLLMSNSAMQGIVSNAKEKQDNVLLEYEIALILYKYYGVRVMPIFLAELKESDKGIKECEPFRFNHDFPDLPHKRKESAQEFVEQLSNLIPDKNKFLGSIKKTMEEVFNMQGAKMPNRLEDTKETVALIDRIVEMINSATLVRPKLPTPSSFADSPLLSSSSSSFGSPPASPVPSASSASSASSAALQGEVEVFIQLQGGEPATQSVMINSSAPLSELRKQIADELEDFEYKYRFLKTSGAQFSEKQEKLPNSTVGSAIVKIDQKNIIKLEKIV